MLPVWGECNRFKLHRDLQLSISQTNQLWVNLGVKMCIPNQVDYPSFCLLWSHVQFFGKHAVTTWNAPISVKTASKYASLQSIFVNIQYRINETQYLHGRNHHHRCYSFFKYCLQPRTSTTDHINVEHWTQCRQHDIRYSVFILHVTPHTLRVFIIASLYLLFVKMAITVTILDTL